MKMKLALNYFLLMFQVFALFNSAKAFSKDPIHPTRLEQLTGVKTNLDAKHFWDDKYNKKNYIYGKSPAPFLAENFDIIPRQAQILDMGMGEGRNAVFLAQKGHAVTGVDISSVAVKKAQDLAGENSVKIKTMVASLNDYPFPPHSFDVIICFYYVDRKLISKMYQWLKPSGIIIYEAFTLKERDKFNLKNEPEEFFLKPQELLYLFKDFRLLKYEEPLHENSFRASAIFKKEAVSLSHWIKKIK
jgi:tellurite methyltransferase